MSGTSDAHLHNRFGALPPAPEATDASRFQERLRARAAKLDETYRAAMDAAIAHLRRTGAAARAKAEGERAPDFSLPDREGTPVALSEMLRDGPVVLSFFRGEWCSFCRLEIEALIEAYPRIAAEGARLLLISPQDASEALAGQSAAHAGITVLHDAVNGVGLQYGLVFRMPDVLRAAMLAAGIDLSHVYGRDGWLLPIPATYVIDRDRLIALAHVDPDFSRRLDPEAIVAMLKAMPGA